MDYKKEEEEICLGQSCQRYMTLDISGNFSQTRDVFKFFLMTHNNIYIFFK